MHNAQPSSKPQHPSMPARRTMIKTGAAAAMAGILPSSFQPLASAAGTGAARLGKPELEEVKIGFIPLTDCAPVVMASVLGLDKKYGIRIIPSKQASWAAVRDNLLTGGIQFADVLYGLIYGVQLGVGGPRSDMALLMTLNRNGQGITLSDALAREGVTTGPQLARAVLAKKRTYTFAQTFPTSTHAMWLYYWLASYGIDPMRDAKEITVPPPQMVANMRVGAMDGCCVGEPWNAVAIAQKVGFSAATSQDVWPDHPEKVLGTTAAFARKYPNTTKAVMAAVLEACRWIDASEANRTKMAETIAAPGYVNTTVDAILPRILGHYSDGLGKSWTDKHPMTFHAEGQVNFPWLSDGMWFLTQFRRWGLVKTDPDYLTVARAVNRTELYSEVAQAVGVAVPRTSMRSSTLIDGVVWDGHDPKAYAHGFKVNDLAA